MSRFAINCLCPFKPTIHRQPLSLATRQHYRLCMLAHDISHGTFYKSLGNRQAVYSQATCRTQHSIFPCATPKNNNVAVLPATKVVYVWSVMQLQTSPMIYGPKYNFCIMQTHVLQVLPIISHTCPMRVLGTSVGQLMANLDITHI